MKKTLNFLFIMLFIIVIAYLFSPDKEYKNKLWTLKGISLAQPYKAAVIEYVQKTNALPGAGDLEHEKIHVQVDLNSSPVKTITVGENGPGTVTVHYSTAGIESAPAELDNSTIILTPDLTENKLMWSCRGEMPSAFIPRNCK